MKRSKGSHPVSDVRGHNDETSIFGSRTMDFSFGWWSMSKECHLSLSSFIFFLRQSNAILFKYESTSL